MTPSEARAHAPVAGQVVGDAAPVASLPLPPGPRGLPLVGVLPGIWRDPLGFFSGIGRDFGGLARFGNRKFTLYLLSDPEGIRRVLASEAGRYWKGEGLAAARTVMGSGLATSHGDFWRSQRRRIQPSFLPARLGHMVPLARAAAAEVFDTWERAANVDIVGGASRITQRVLFRGLFGGDVESLDTAAMSRALEVANAHIHKSAWTLVPLPEWLPTPSRVRFRRAMELLDDSVLGLIADRRAQLAAGTGDEGEDLLGRMLRARDPEASAAGADDEGMTDRMLRDEIMTLFVAGHDTTSAAIIWSLYVLSRHPEAAARIAAEADAAAGDGELDASDVASLDWTGRVVQEILRLYPPGWIVVRTPREEVELCGYRVPKDAPVLISPWVVHRDPELWPDPLRFDPDRFLRERIEERPRFAWFPYGGGARTCVGNHLADLVLRTVVAECCRRFRFGRAPGQRDVQPLPQTTLQPKGPVRLSFEAR